MARFSREESLIGPQGLQRLEAAHVAVFGAGGVGGYVIEALARSGVGAITVVDNDVISLSNCNRQILALDSTLGQPKALVAKNRILDINPACHVTACELFFTPENSGGIDFSLFDYVADAIDTVSAKVELIRCCQAAGTPVITCMGAGNKLDAAAFRVTDINETSVCPLARVMRRELKKQGITGVKAVWSPEPPQTPRYTQEGETKGTAGRPAPGSMATVPSVAGLLMAGEILNSLLSRK